MMHYHLIGIGGTGLSAIARVLFERGNEVSGSDMVLSVLAQELIEIGIPISIGHAAENIKSADIIIRSSAIPDSNIEVIAAEKAGIPILKRRDFLTALTSGKKIIAVAGTHGKTTTSAMIAWTLITLGMDPSYIVGGILKNTSKNAHAGSGAYFVIEADEYDRMFLGLSPDILVITNIEHDHPDCFPTKQEYINAFIELTQKIKTGGILITCGDLLGTTLPLPDINRIEKYITYGSASSSDIVIKDIHHNPEYGIKFDLSGDIFTAENGYHISLSIPGIHNAYNAAAVIAVIKQIGMPITDAITALENFSGTGRRFDILGEINGVSIIDDYAHHPTEIQATLAAARGQYPKKNIWVVWQPHTYSRIQELFEDFIKSFDDSDHVIVTEIYASRENTQDYSAKKIAEKINHPDVIFFPKLNEVSDFLQKNLSQGDVLIVLSAGDANSISTDVLKFLQKRGTSND